MTPSCSAPGRFYAAFATLLLGLTLVLGSTTALADTQGELREQVQQIQDDSRHIVEGQTILTGQILQPLYALRGYLPLWTNPAQVDELIALIADAPSHGLRSDDYLRDTLVRLKNDPSQNAANFDLLLSEALIRYVYTRVFGKVKADTIDHFINFERSLDSGMTPDQAIAALLQADSLSDEIDRSTAHGPWYRALQRELKTTMALDAAGGWDTFPEGPTLRTGDSGPRVEALRRRLELQPGYAATSSASPQLFDEALEFQVRRFQKDHALDVDGAVGPATIEALNVPASQRAQQLRLTLERLRWVSGDLETKHSFIAVNIAGYRVYVVEDGEITWTTRAVVGTPYRETPVFTGRMSYMEFNPTWTIPPGILAKDTLPSIHKNPDYLASKNIEVLNRNGAVVDPATVDWSQYRTTAPYTFRQTPGPWNALGQVKFIFPNQHFVFLHDTPGRKLFDRTDRAFSSGCIRVEDPMTLAEILLGEDDQWNRNRIDETVASGVTTRVSVADKTPVYLLYLTAAVDDDGSVIYHSDLYGRDDKLLKALNAPLQIILPKSLALN